MKKMVFIKTENGLVAEVREKGGEYREQCSMMRIDDSVIYEACDCGVFGESLGNKQYENIKNTKNNTILFEYKSIALLHVIHNEKVTEDGVTKEYSKKYYSILDRYINGVEIDEVLKNKSVIANESGSDRLTLRVWVKNVEHYAKDGKTVKVDKGYYVNLTTALHELLKSDNDFKTIEDITGMSIVGIDAHHEKFVLDNRIDSTKPMIKDEHKEEHRVNGEDSNAIDIHITTVEELIAMFEYFINN